MTPTPRSAAIALDALLIPRRKRLVIGSSSPASLQVGEVSALKVEVSTGEGRPTVRVSVLAEMNDVFQPEAERPAAPFENAVVASIPLVTTRRGTGTIDAVWLRLSGPLGLAEKRFRHVVAREVAVLPDVRPVRAAALRAAVRATPAAGPRTMRLVGEGSEFASLREYVPGFDYRAMSWRASARHRQLLVREFHAERDQPVVLAFDTGHLMSEPLDGIPRLDHAIRAGLLLAWSCLKTGDRVGLFSFGARPSSFRAPEAGAGTFGAIRAWTNDLEYGTDETNYTLALSNLSERLSRRALVVLMTDFVDVVAAKLMIDNVAKLSRRHLVLFVTLTDPAPRRLLGANLAEIGDVHRAVVAGQLLREREVVLGQLRRLGVHCIDAEPRQVHEGLVQKYLWIKRRELI